MNEEYLDLFVDESSQHLQEMTNGLMSLESEPQNPDVIQTVFRAAHTLKGMAGTMGFDHMARLTHEMENGLDSMRHGELHPTEEVIDALFACVDVLTAQLDAVMHSGSDEGIDETAARHALAQVLSPAQTAATVVESPTTSPVSPSGSASPSNPETENPNLSNHRNEQNEQDKTSHGLWWEPLQGGIAAVAASGVNVAEVVITMVPDCPMPGVRAFMAFRSTSDFGEVLASEPSAEEIQAGECGFRVKLILATDARPDEMVAVLRDMADIDSVEVRPLEFPQSDEGINTSMPSQASTEAGSENSPRPGQTQEGKHDSSSQGDNPPKPSPHSPAAQQVHSPTTHQKVRSGQTIRVDQEKIDALMNLFSEFVIDKTRLESIAERRGDSELTETVSHIARLGSELQDVVLQIRMVPVDTVFNRFPRMVRDLAKTLAKQVRLEIEGAETELDRTLVDEIGDPLVHLIRNALDHGLESPEQRVESGKPEVGELRLVAYQARNKVYIEIRDDGRGIDRERVLQKAIREGQLTEQATASLADADVYDLLFQSGFSTAEAVSDISGRGVGLDAVKSKIQSLGGDVRVDSTIGQGSTFLIELPLTLSIMQAMLVRVAGETYAVPLGDIAHILRVQEDELQRVRDRDMVVFMDKLIPLARLPMLLGNPKPEEAPLLSESQPQGVPVQGLPHQGENRAADKLASPTLDLGLALLVARKGDRYVALEVEEFLGQQEIVIKSIGSYFKTLPTGVAGATILGDGRVALILDTYAWLR